MSSVGAPLVKVEGRRLSALEGADTLIHRNYLVYRRDWVVFVTGFLEPVFYLLSIGIGMVLFTGPIFAGASALAATEGLRAWYWRTYTVFVAGAFSIVGFPPFSGIFGKVTVVLAAASAGDWRS